MTPATRFSRRTAIALLGSTVVAGSAVAGIAQRATAQTAPTFSAGKTAVVSAAQLNVRSTPSLSAPIVATLPLNTQVYLATGPVTADGYTWFRLQSPSAAGTSTFLGWAVTAFLAGVAAPPVQQEFAYGSTVSVTANLLNVRANPSTSAAIVATYAFGRTAKITGGPTVANGITWYAVDNVGWVAGQFLAKSGGTTPPPASGGFAVGTVVAVNVPSVNIRSGAGTSFPVNSTAAQGTQLTIAEGPVAASGYNWYRVTGGATGWVAGELVVQSGGTTPPPTSGGIAIGSTVRVTAQQVNVRSGAGTSFSVTTTASAGDTFTVYEGPVAANGYNWYRVSNLVGAWIASDFIAVSGSTTPPPAGGFSYGQRVTVTAGTLNVRANPTTSAAIISTYAYGRAATITGGPTVANGITWYAVDNLGWVSGQYLTA
ncbi:MAG TPA: SH3 domain-containing protein [Thermomicrobiales bacterium]|jgi:uncharacterized protein YgiM (DUF1202 family)|nr:SH3 domain-containing protein [Thermomicrobiales bacterium]